MGRIDRGHFVLLSCLNNYHCERRASFATMGRRILFIEASRTVFESDGWVYVPSGFYSFAARPLPQTARRGSNLQHVIGGFIQNIVSQYNWIKFLIQSKK
jgi:hypothetical protein